MSKHAEVIVTAYNECITHQDTKGLSDLMTDDHAFVDSAGNAFQGKEKAIAAWKGFFGLFPDYQNVFEHVTSSGNTVTIKGYSVCSNPQLDGPALWKATLDKDKVSIWQVYEDTPQNRKTLGII